MGVGMELLLLQQELITHAAQVARCWTSAHAFFL
jgi:hypothetical protein